MYKDILRYPQKDIIQSFQLKGSICIVNAILPIFIDKMHSVENLEIFIMEAYI